MSAGSHSPLSRSLQKSCAASSAEPNAGACLASEGGSGKPSSTAAIWASAVSPRPSTRATPAKPSHFEAQSIGKP